MRLDVLDASSIVNCQWTVGPSEYAYLRQFYVLNVRQGAAAFLIDLILDDSLLTEYTARFVPDTWSLSSHSGLSYTVTAQLEIEAIEQDYEYLDRLMDLVTAYGGIENLDKVLDLLDILVNQKLPLVPND